MPSPHPKTHLVIGCGYLGRRVADVWLNQGDRVLAVTRSTARADEFRRAGLIPIVADVTNPVSLPHITGIDTLLYAVGLDRSAGQSQRTVYVDGLRNVVSAITPATGAEPAESPSTSPVGVSGERQTAPPAGVGIFLYISSTSVYGQAAGEWVDEVSETVPTAENGRVCLDAERLLKESIPQAIILRSAGIYGPGRMVARLESLRAGTPVTGNPDAWLNLIHVDDLVNTVLRCQSCGVPGDTYLVTDDAPLRRRDFYQRVADFAGAPAPTFAPLPIDSAERTVFNKRCSNRRLRHELKVELRFPTVAEGIPDALGPSPLNPVAKRPAPP
ncbi:MAG: SDR family oxidoreductase [Planctomycetota bacterium]|nr:SDR family oxidoreductase [Planctomycetota bacterium]